MARLCRHVPDLSQSLDPPLPPLLKGGKVRHARPASIPALRRGAQGGFSADRPAAIGVSRLSRYFITPSKIALARVRSRR